MEIKQITVWVSPAAGTQHATEALAIEAECRALARLALAEVDDALDTCLENKVCGYDLAVEFLRQSRRVGVLDHVLDASKDADDQ